MFPAFQVFCVLLVSVAMALAVAHALEIPGKLRLDQPTYTAVQAIYYPGFTIGGMVGEAGGIVATFILLLVTPREHATFGWTLAALILLVATQATYWLLTHPVNRFWLREQKLSRLGGRFFAADPLKRGAADESGPDAFRHFRNRWEFSHVVRAVLAMASLFALVTGLALD